jgi:spore maturation protein CgeB
MKILQIGAKFGTTIHRYEALKRLGYEVFFIDLNNFLPNNRWMNKWIYETGAWGLEIWFEQHILNSIKDNKFDLAIVDGGYLISPKLVKLLKNRIKNVANYNADDPFPLSGWRKWRLYRKSIPYYDLLVVCRQQNVNEVKSLGAKKVILVHRTADEIAHKPILLTSSDYETWGSEVVFVGTWMPERGPFMARVIDRGVPLSIWGDRWRKAKEWNKIKHTWRGPGIFNENYSRVIQTSKICLGLVSKTNRDLHTRRSIEIPALGSLLCCERTTEHELMYEDGKEAVMWNDADNCADLCLELLKSDNKRIEIAKNGNKRCIKNNYFNEPVLASIIYTATS